MLATPPNNAEEQASWWSTVTPRELAASSGLQSGLLCPALHAAGSDPKPLARALAIHQLFWQESLLTDLIAESNEKCATFCRLEKTSDLSEANAWLVHCALLTKVFAQAVEMLGGEAPGQSWRRLLDRLVILVDTLRGHLVSMEVSKGTTRNITVPRRAIFRQRDSS